MHAEKQVRDTPSRMFIQPEGKGTQQFRLRDNRGSAAPILDNRSSSVLQAKCMNSIPCMQRKLPNDPDLTPSGRQAKVWLGNIDDPKEKSKGILCNEISVIDSGDKAEALKNISTKAGEVGATTHKAIWAESDNNYNKVDSPLINPFQVPIMAKYGVNPSDSKIKLFYHYGPYNHGYIVKVELGYNSSVETGTMNNKDQVGENEYSSKHDTKDDRIILNQTEDQDNAKKFDAYTKLAGEGARFQCVKRNINTISNNTVICVPYSNQGVAFCELWKTWGATFNKEFNIKDDAIIDNLWKNNDKLHMYKTMSSSRVEKEDTEVKSATSDKIELLPSDDLKSRRLSVVMGDPFLDKLEKSIADSDLKMSFNGRRNILKGIRDFKEFQKRILNMKKGKNVDVFTNKETAKNLIDKMLLSLSP